MKLRIERGISGGMPYLKWNVNGQRCPGHVASRRLTGSTGEHGSGVLISTHDAVNIAMQYHKRTTIFVWAGIDFNNDTPAAIRMLLMKRIVDVRNWIETCQLPEYIDIEIPDLVE